MILDTVKITYKYGWRDNQNEVELPLKLLVIGDFTRRPDDIIMGDRKAINIDKDNFNEVMAFHKLSLAIRVKNYLSEAEKNNMDVNLKFSSLSDFAPDSILKQVPELKEFIKPFDGRKLTEGELDALSKQLDGILHHPDFQKLEAAWMGLKFLVDRTDFRKNIKIELLNVSKEDLFKDFKYSHKITQSGLFQIVYKNVYYAFGGEPYGAIIANYEFTGFSRHDIRLLQYIASVAAMSHCPFIASAGPNFFGIDDFSEFSKVKDLTGYFNGINYKRWEYFRYNWQSLRESADARYVALAMLRFLLRLPYSEKNPVKAFNYIENVSGSHENYLWGNAAFAFASNLTKSFAKYKLCANIIGPRWGGKIEDLSVHKFDSIEGPQTKGPTEVHISDRREYELSEEGFMALTTHKEGDDACFFTANSIQKPKDFPDAPEGRKELSDYKIVAQLPYLFIITRFAQYIKVLYKINIGKWRYDKKLLQNELNNWIRKYYVKGCQRKPLRTAQIVIEDFDDEYAEYRFLLKISPNTKYWGAYFNLNLLGILG